MWCSASGETHFNRMHEIRIGPAQVKMEEILDTALGPKTADNAKMLQFLKSMNLFNKIKKKNIV